MNDPEDTHDVDVCPNKDCRAIESFHTNVLGVTRCEWCRVGVCLSCLSEPVEISRDGRCDECGGEHCDICGARCEIKDIPLCKRCERTARAGGKMLAEEQRQLREFGGDLRRAKR